MMDNLITSLVGATSSIGHDTWYRDHSGMSWIFGFHGLFWLLIVASIAAILIFAFRLATRECRSCADVQASEDQSSTGRSLTRSGKTS